MNLTILFLLIQIFSKIYCIDKRYKRNLLTCTSDQIVVNNACQTNDLDISYMNSEVKIFSEVGMILKWGFSENDKVDFYMEIKQSSWMSIGIGSSMKEADVFYTEIDGPNLKLIDGSLHGYHDPKIDNQNDLIILGYRVSNSITSVKFQRAFDTGDSNDKVLLKDNDYTFIAAYTNSDSVQEHSGSQASVFDITLTENFSGTAKSSQTSTINNLHVFTLLVAWGILVDIGIGIVQHFKTWKWYQWAHAFVFFIVDLLTIIFVILKMQNNDGGNGKKAGSIHGTVGFIFFIILIFQHILGVLIKLCYQKFQGRYDYISYIQLLHKYLGYFLYIVAKLLILIGGIANDHFEESGNTYFIVSLIIVILSVIGQVISQFFYFQNQKRLQQFIAVESHETSIKYFVKNNNHNKELENLISQGFSYKQVQAKLNEEIKYCIFGNKIISLQNIFHPGGNYIFNKIYGREIDRFFFGGYALEGDNRRSHQHTPKAELFTLKNVVGELKLPESHLILKHTNKKQKIDCTYYNAWHISQLNKYSKTSYFIYLQNNKFQIKNYMEGIDWFGKYFQVKLEHNDKRRLYTIVNCLNQDNIKFRQQLLEFVSTNFKNGKVDKMPEYSDNLKLCIKKYKPEEKTLSSLIFQSLNKQLYVKGPLGQGLQIGNIGQGKIAIIVAGTGVLPFLDLLNFMLQKVIYEVAKKEIGKQFADQQIDIHNIGLDKCLNNIQIQFFASFVNEQEFYGKEIIVPLAQLCQKNNFNYFSNKIKVKIEQAIPGINIEKERFDKNYFQRNYSAFKDVKRVYVCGPPSFNKNIPIALKEKIPEESIQFI